MSIKRYEPKYCFIEAVKLSEILENKDLARKFFDGHPFELYNNAKVGDYIIKTSDDNFFAMDENDFNSLYEEY